MIPSFCIQIGGVAITIIGVVAVATSSYYRFAEFDDGNWFKSAAVIEIIFGVAISIFAFLGCCGAIKQNKCLLFTYAVLTLIAFILVLVAGVLAVVYKGDVKEVISKELDDTISRYNEIDADLRWTNAWDTLQKGVSVISMKTQVEF
jgi:ABC-type transport system involved in multi-copper enzyme maturation permease subunit